VCFRRSKSATLRAITAENLDWDFFKMYNPIFYYCRFRQGKRIRKQQWKFAQVYVLCLEQGQ
jgi:hypothetical protein